MLPRYRNALFFGFCWMLLLLLYWPAATAGWVSDTLGWLEALQRLSFRDFVASKGFGVPSFYQLTQAVTWLLFQLVGANAWAWHLIHLSLHALNATLLFSLLRGLLKDAQPLARTAAPLFAALLFCVAPSVSEVIVWEASFHFLQGMLLLLLQMHLLRRHLHHAAWPTAMLACLLFALSTFSLEYFYLVPFLQAALCLYYAKALQWNQAVLRRTWLHIVWPQALMLACYLIGLQWYANATTGRLGNAWMHQPIQTFFVKPPELVFHLFGGRFLPQVWRDIAYAACASYAGAAIFYVAFAALFLLLLLRFKRLSARGRLMTFLLVWLLAGLALESPLWFPQHLLIISDRYLYLLLPPFFGLIALALDEIRNLRLRLLISLLLLLPAPVLTFYLNKIWQQSERMTTVLQQGLTDVPDKTTILLNNPASLRGALMIGAGDDGEARLMHNLLFKPPILGQMYDAPAQNLLSPDDSIRIEKVDAQTIRVSLTRKGAFWQYGTDLAHSFSTSDFSVQVEDPYCCYLLHLTHPAGQYRLLYQHGGTWQEFKLSSTY